MAQAYPARPIRFIVPLAPGGGLDFVARLVGEYLSRTIGQQVYLENKLGAGGMIGIETAAKSPPDGYSVLVSNDNVASAPHVLRVNTDFVKDLVPVIELSRQTLVLAVHSSFNVKSVAELIAAVKAQPGMSFATSGVGSNQHILGEWFAKEAGIKLEHVPYRGAGQAVNDFIAGHILIGVLGPTALIPHYKTGTLRFLAQSSKVRTSSLPDVPTFEEAGMNGIVLETWYGAFVPSGTPGPIIARLNAEMNKAVADPATRDSLLQTATEPVGGSAEQFARVVQEDFGEIRPARQGSSTSGFSGRLSPFRLDGRRPNRPFPSGRRPCSLRFEAPRALAVRIDGAGEVRINRCQGGIPMRLGTSRVVTSSRAALLGVSLIALSASAFAAEYKMTVNKDRLINSANEPQNWLMMNGDYGSTRYSKLAQINRDNVKNLHMVWAMALRGMQDVGQNGPENEVNPLIDNGFMYTSDGWGTVYKIDVRSGDHGEFVWIADPGVKHEGNIPQTRGIALWEDLVIANLPDGRVIAINRDSGEIVWDKQVAKPNEFGSKERFRSAPIAAEGKIIVANGSGDAGTRGWLAGARRQDRQRAVALVRRSRSPAIPAARPGRTRTTPGRPAAAACGRPAPTIPSTSSRSGAPAIRSRCTIRSRGRATTSIPTRWSPSTSIPASSSGTTSICRTTPGTMTRSASRCSTTSTSTANRAR